MARISIVLLFSFFFLSGVSAKHNHDNEQWYIRSIKIVEGHAQNMLDEVLKDNLLPRSAERGRLPIEEWTSGFYPGILWYLYEYTGDKYWKGNAEQVTALLEEQQYNKNDHDIGFRISCSYGKGYELTHNENYPKVIIQSAKSLCTRYNEKIKAILSWNPTPKRDWKFPVIIDNMMNLELLYQASELSKDKHYAEIAYNHAITTMENHFRNDYSCPHVVDYDPESGKMRRMDFNNGHNDASKAAWSRGQAWALYGFTLMYRETKDKKFLDFAENIASYILNNPTMPEDMIPYWDYNAPKIPTKRDAAAAAINASALLELSTYGTKNSDRYFKAAEKTLRSLSSENYLSSPGTNGNFALKHATGNFLGGVEIDCGIVYADYYFIEALCRYLKLIKHQNLF